MIRNLIPTLTISALMLAGVPAYADEPSVPSPEAQQIATEAVVAVQATTPVASPAPEVVVPVAPTTIVEVPLGGSGPTVLVPAKPRSNPDKVSFFGKPHWGFGMSIGIPAGVGVQFVMNPWLDWARLDISFQENVLSPGGRLGLQLDPLAVFHRLPFGVFADGQVGFFPQGNIPGHSSSLPSVGYTYETFMGGIRLGKPNGFHWNFEAGLTHLGVTTGNFQSVVNKNGGSNTGNLVLGNPTASITASPAVETGFTVVWP